jgi:ribonuclease-3
MLMENSELCIGYTFRNRCHLQLALVHKSANNVVNNERLEFLGDSILTSIVAAELYLNSKEPPAVLAPAKSTRTRNSNLVRVARAHNLGAWLVLGAREQADGGRDKPSILGDMVEALIGAAFLDGGMDAAYKVVKFLGI